MERKSLRVNCLHTVVHDIANSLTIRAQSPPEPPALASRQEIYDSILIEASCFTSTVLYADPSSVRTQILRLAASCAFALASIDQGEIDW
jgi:hypothetical protein